MAKRKVASKRRGWDRDDFSVTDHDLFKEMCEEATRDSGVDEYVSDTAHRLQIGLPLQYFSQRYIYQLTHIPLGRMIHIKGETESMKSTYSFDVLRMFASYPLGGGIYFLNEPRDQAEMRAGILCGRGCDEAVKRVRVEKCRSLENAQERNTEWISRLNDKYREEGSCIFPMCWVIDSVVGSASEKTIEGIRKTGHAQVGYAKEANLINTYTKFIFHEVEKWPVLWLGTNHLKYGTDNMGRPLEKTAGGAAVRFYATFEFRLRRLKDYKRLSESGRQIEIKVTKNSLGDARHKINVDVLWHRADGRLLAYWDWAAASIDFLTQFTGIDAKETWRRRVDEIVDLDIDRTRRTVSSKVLGVSKVSYGEAGDVLETNLEVRRALDDLFGIGRCLTFQPGIPYSKQLLDALKEEPAEDMEEASDADAEGGADG